MSASIRLLIVDGHEGVRNALAQRLRTVPGVQVVAAVDNLDDAVEMMQDLAPDVVVYDPKTIDGDAVVATRRLADGGCPIVVLTSSLLEGEALALSHAGAAAVLLKGNAIAALLDTIESLSGSRSGSTHPASHQ